MIQTIQLILEANCGKICHSVFVVVGAYRCTRDGAMQVFKEEDSSQAEDNNWSNILTTKLHPNSVTLLPGYWHHKYVYILLVN